MFALFHIKTGELIKTYDTERGARYGMRTSNRNAGWERLSRSWTNGYEMEWCRNTNGMFAPIHTYGHAPYGIIPYDKLDRYKEQLRITALRKATELL